MAIMNFEERLKNRYGQARFNPAGGQTQMTFQEWIDRHPGLAPGGEIKDEAAARAKYEQAVSQEGGEAYQAANPRWATQDPGVPQLTRDNPLNNDGSLTRVIASLNPAQQQTAQTPAQGAVQRRIGTYKDYVKSHGGKSTAALAGQYRAATGGEVTDKMANAMEQTSNKRKAALAKKNKKNPKPATTPENFNRF